MGDFAMPQARLNQLRCDSNSEQTSPPMCRMEREWERRS